MPLLNKLRQRFIPSRRKESEPATAYDTWSASYDHQPDNLMLALDERLCTDLLLPVNLTGKVVADIGCGTGRHWKKIVDRQPARLVGYDVSAGMLAILRQKYPDSETYLLKGTLLQELPDASCDLVLSTLTVAHIPDLETALQEWYRILRPGGDLIITDFHPEALAKGGQRTFRDGDKVIAVRNHVYPLRQLRKITGRLGLQEQQLVEKEVDDTMKPYYEKQQALAVFERFRGVRIIYGIHLKKADVAS